MIYIITNAFANHVANGKRAVGNACRAARERDMRRSGRFAGRYITMVAELEKKSLI